MLAGWIRYYVAAATAAAIDVASVAAAAAVAATVVVAAAAPGHYYCRRRGCCSHSQLLIVLEPMKRSCFTKLQFDIATVRAQYLSALHKGITQPEDAQEFPRGL